MLSVMRTIYTLNNFVFFFFVFQCMCFYIVLNLNINSWFFVEAVFNAGISIVI
ncbi:hypothetical protein HanIR_Chr04g0194921 [Helianthus annuus]|nr:hypothetical protein HanIR_Chr04g0194921 [Helianthus annuus]